MVLAKSGEQQFSILCNMGGLTRTAPSLKVSITYLHLRIKRKIMTTDKLNQTIKLKDGRTLGYAEYGAPEGKPVFYFHGSPSSRLEARLFHETPTRLGVRVIAVDRPGLGLSDFKRGRKFLDWPDDVIELADALGIDRFAVMGVSGGGPYAAACALKIPQRLTAAAIVSCFGPYDVPRITDGIARPNRLNWLLARRAPWLYRLFLGQMMVRPARRDPDGTISRFAASVPEPDKKVLAQPGVGQMFMDMIIEAVRSGTRGAAWDSKLLTRPWGFRPQDISMEVHLWHGEADINAPPAMGRYVASAIPNCRAKFLPDEGHISLFINHIGEILSVLVA